MKRFILLLALVSTVPVAAQDAPSSGSDLWDRFQSPPNDARPMVRWWWFGPAVDTAELDREIVAMKAGGFGGFEVQPTYPLSLDDPAVGIRTLPYLSDPFLSALRHVGDTAHATGMRMDVTIGSGWPFGGPHVPVSQAAAEVHMVKLPVPAGADRVPLPSMQQGERALAIFIDGQRLTMIGADTISVKASPIERQAMLFGAGRTGQQVKRAAVGAEGFVIDHVSIAAVTNHLKTVGDRLLSAFAGTAPPYAMFSDSLEVYGSSWTHDLPEQFRRRRGYDLLDHLPALFADTPDSAAVRFDWSRTLSELVDERYLRPITDWAHARGTRFRAQVYGIPPPTLSSNALVDLPEGEGADWRSFTSTRWATSAAHLYGRPVVSSETWTWLHSPAWAATPLDMKVEADRHFLQGVNQIVGHGWPYSPPGAGEPGWAFYAAAALSDHNPWYPAMPAVTQYLQRVSAMLREGTPDGDVAIYLPIEDAFADMRPAHASVNEEKRSRLRGDVVAQVLDAGHGFDFVDAQAVVAGKLNARVLVLPGLTRMDPAALRAIATWVDRGGLLVATGAAPAAAGGLRDGRAGSLAVRPLVRSIFRMKNASIVPPQALGETLRRITSPTMVLAQPDAAVGFVRRKIPGGDLYFVVNTSARSIRTTARFAGDTGNGEWWDPLTGTRQAAGGGDIALSLAPYQSRLLVMSPKLPAARAAQTLRPLMDLSTGWEMTLRAPPPGTSWTSVAALRHYSGAIRYSRRFVLPKRGSSGRVILDFGEGTPLPDIGGDRPRAAIAAPVREAAIIRINDREAGTVWAAPWQIDIGPFLRSGQNQIDVTVMNGATNALSARTLPDRRLLTMRYGERFVDQDRDKLAPAPSGLLSRITLNVASSDAP
ncbi:glycosyl hydrolase [Sphingomonas sp. Leaf339]|uniref:glycosyl hydrolase n=1 Tax=Sphingomonas sp. Leaf339 TaxID=1736343 RepID=UPI000ABF2CDD|nr:glycosyl hydrolase [Sphingomonas sp. Leaf339]